MKTVADPHVLRSLTNRLDRLSANAHRHWGTLTPHEMLCHLGDATAMVLMVRPRTEPLPGRRRILVKWLVLWSPIPWPHGWPTNPTLNPRAGGTKPSDFAKDRTRAVAGLEALATADPGGLEPVHGFFGNMSMADWQRWAYRHTDHHLRQFGS
jgi:hypothetical protein